MIQRIKFRLAFLTAASVSILTGFFLWINTLSDKYFVLSSEVFGLMSFLFNFVFVYLILSKFLNKRESNKEQIVALKQAEKYRKEFLGNVSHELKTPIFNVQGYILTLLDGGLDDPEINKKYLQRAETNINRMISIVEDLETISKYEARELLLDYSVFDILEVVKSVFEMLEMSADEQNIKLSVVHDRPEILVEADKNRVTEVLLNLVANSIRYGIVSGRTNIYFKENRSHVRVDVTDNGIGIAQKHLSRIFERFYRVDKSRSQKNGGTGLGLSIVKHIIDAHNQTITVMSKPSIGTTFTFTLNKPKQHSNTFNLLGM